MSAPIDLPPLNPSEDEPLVSVAVASYEADRDRVAQLLESIANQPYGNVEVVIADSSQLTFLAETADRTDWVRHIPTEPRGVSTGFNEAIDHAEGDIVGIIADDDFVTDQRFTRTVEAIRDGADVVYGDVYDLDEDTDERSYRSAMEISDPERLWVKLFRFDGVAGSIPAATVTFRAECVENERFDGSLAGGEDYHLWVRLFKQYQPAYVSEPLAVMRQHDESLSSDPDLMYENRMKAIDLLVERYPELQNYADERRRLERYDYARNLMFDGRLQEARHIFTELTREGYTRAAVMGVISLLPTGHEWIVRRLDRLRMAVQ